MRDKQVCRIIRQDKTNLSPALAAAWSRVSHEMGRGTFCDKAGFGAETLGRAVTGPALPSAVHLLNSLAADPTALNEVLGLYGMYLAPAYVDPTGDLELAARLGHTLAELIERLRDGKRCHVDTAVLAAMFRHLIPQMQAIVAEAEGVRS